MDKMKLDALAMRLFGSVGQQTIFGKVVYYLAYGMCTYCAILRGVLVGIGLGLYTHVNIPTLILGTVLILIAALLTAIERTAK